jgi:hypothetical protein
MSDGREALVEIDGLRVVSSHVIGAREMRQALQWIETHAEELKTMFEDLQK